MNKFHHSITKRIGQIVLLALILPAGPAAVFSIRLRNWERQVERDEDGVAEFAGAYTLEGMETAFLLVHGFGDTPQVWFQLAPELAKRGNTVRAMRLPGWGEPVAAKRRTRREDWFAAIEQELRALRKTHRTVVVLGHSKGGALCAWLATHGRLDADALILYAPMFEISNERSPLLSARQWYSLGHKLLPGRMTVESLFGDHVRVAEPRSRTQRDPFVPVSLYRSLFELMRELRETSAQTDMPVRLVLPGEDAVVNSGAAREWFDSLSAPSKRLDIEEPAGHVLPLEMNAAAEAVALHTWRLFFQH